jgi:hypothetical protein
VRQGVIVGFLPHFASRLRIFCILQLRIRTFGVQGFFRQDLQDCLNSFLDRINRITWIFSFGRSPEESAQTPIASGE